jgi:hypothetical protein
MKGCAPVFMERRTNPKAATAPAQLWANSDLT